ncbi:MAG TPA: IS66 family transposase [Isosphaeraceae bacterium]|nr:IS66 family transposase [Isosphaeraceae bacterium]
MHDVTPEQRLCPDCGGDRTRIGEEVREQLEYVPASLIVLQHIRPKYACEACQAHVVIAERLPEPIEKGLPGPGLLAHVAVSKYADHLPLYRQEGIFKRFGVDLARSTMCDWMAAAAGLLAPIVQAMLKRVLMSEVVQTDDTPVKVQDHDGKGIKTGRFWNYHGDHNHRYTVYDYTPDRSRDGPERVLKGFEGYLQADAYSAYDALFLDGTIVEVGCWMHARRKFYEARTSDPARSHLVLAWVVGLYKVEEDTKETRKNHPEWDDAAWHAHRYDLRLQRSRPILDAIHAWLEGDLGKVLPKSPIGEAISYALNHWNALIRPLEAGFLEIDNGASERALKPVALGRNYAGLKIMRSRCQGCHVPPAKALGSTPHNPVINCRGIRAASPSGGMESARSTGPSPSSAPPPSSADRPRRTVVSSRGSRGPATAR